MLIADAGSSKRIFYTTNENKGEKDTVDIENIRKTNEATF